MSQKGEHAEPRRLSTCITCNGNTLENTSTRPHRGSRGGTTRSRSSLHSSSFMTILRPDASHSRFNAPRRLVTFDMHALSDYPSSRHLYTRDTTRPEQHSA